MYVFCRINSRPSRKTKEAAALYTEMISKELLRSEDNFEDDDISVESFPELPNIEQHSKFFSKLNQTDFLYSLYQSFLSSKPSLHMEIHLLIAKFEDYSKCYVLN